MRKVKEVLRLYHEKNLSTREIAQSLGIGRSTVHDYLDRAQKAGFGWPLPPDLDEASLEHRLFPTRVPIPSEKRQMPSHGVPEPGAQEEGGDAPAPMG